MSEYVFSCGEDNFPKDGREYVVLNTAKGKQIAIALETSGVPFVGTFTENQMRFSYDPDYKDSVEDIIGKAKSDGHEELLREIREHNDDSAYLTLLPAAAEYLHLSEGTLRKRPDEIQVHLCQMLTRLWYCDTPTIQRELTRAFTANRQTEQDLEEAREREIRQMKPSPIIEEERTGLISREVIRRQAEIIKRKQAVKDKQTAEKTERERKFGQ